MATNSNFWGTTYTPVGQGAQDYSQYDPGNFMKMLQDYLASLGVGGEGGGAAPGAAPAPTAPFDPNTWMTSFTQNFGTIADLISSRTDKMRSDLLTGSGEESRRAGEVVSSQFAGSGVSGARDRAIGEGMASPFAQVAKDVSLAGMGALTSLGGAAMGAGAQASQYADQSQQGWAGLGLQNRALNQQNSQSILDALMGAGNIYSTTVAPTYAGEQGWGQQSLQYLLAALGAGVGLAT